MFDTALGIILKEEGGYADRKADRGGPTNFGITQTTYDAWRLKNGMPDRDVKDIRDDEVRLIYLMFWNSANCPVMPWPLCLVHFDARVNHRPRSADLILQETLGVKCDGIIGPATLAAAAGCEATVTAMKHCDVREKFYYRIVELNRTQEIFLKGWLKRLDGLREIIPIRVAA